jgi:hypothetical protein
MTCKAVEYIGIIVPELVVDGIAGNPASPLKNSGTGRVRISRVFVIQCLEGLEECDASMTKHYSCGTQDRAH